MKKVWKRFKRFLESRAWRRFRSIRRAYISFYMMLFLIFFAMTAELWVNSRPIIVYFEGQFFFPSYGAIIPGTSFGLEYDYETQYRQLQKTWRESQKKDAWMILPLVPYNAFETHQIEGEYPPYPPSLEHRHYLGTDTVGRDVLARLVYGFRIAIFFALLLVGVNYFLGIALGSAMGYFGGNFDLMMQRIIEIWSNIPFLYVVIIMSALITPNFFALVGIMVLFGWMSMTSYVRTATYREKTRDYCLAAQATGASTSRILFRHILPNTFSIIISFVPFSMANSIVALTSLDYLGFGLPPPTPSWGELLSQGVSNLSATWIAASVVCSMILILTMVTFIGEGLREGFDPKSFSIFE